MLQRASQENPFDLIGAMFIVEGLGQRVARQWGERIQEQLGLPGDAVSFFLYHSESDVKHFQRLDQAIAAGILTEKLVADIVRCAKVLPGQFDWTWEVIRALRALGLATRVRLPGKHDLAGDRIPE